MSCVPDKVKDYFFGEVSEGDRAALRAHLKECPACGEEFERLRLTQAALRTLPDEEPPRRTAFVSDKVFEPSWWQRLWQSGPRLGFASAGMLSVAIVIHAAWMPKAAPAPVAADQAAIERRVAAEVAARLEPAIKAAVAEAEVRQERKTAETVEAMRKQFEFQQQADRLAVQDAMRQVERKLLVATRLAYNAEGAR